VSVTAADGLRFVLNRSYYYGAALFLAAIVVLFAASLWFGGAPLPILLLFSCAIAYGVAGLCVIVWILCLPEPVVCIDQNGFHDRRMTRSPVTWDRVKAVYPVGGVWPSAAADPFGIKMDVTTKAGIAFVPWRNLGLGHQVFVGREGLTMWGDLVISLLGLSFGSSAGRDAIAKQIVNLAEANLPRGTRTTGVASAGLRNEG
jgi:hypothetical protein